MKMEATVQSLLSASSSVTAAAAAAVYNATAG